MSTVQVGSMRLYDAVQPALRAALYRITSKLNIIEVDAGTLAEKGTLVPPEAHTAHVNVSGPRFSLGPEEIAECYPPVKGSGAFSERLPHVVLSRRTLPWERLSGADLIPWLALLVFRSSEATLVPGKLKALLPQSVITLLESQPIDGDPDVTVLKVHDLTTFRAVLPARGEVKLLAHIRQVNVADSALAGSDDDGWFAVVTANRLPLLGSDETTASYLACLVSLEGRGDLWNLPDGQPPPPILVLYSWIFTITEEGGTFERVVRSLKIKPFGVGSSGESLVDASGAVTIDQVDRMGNHTAMRYRGPLLGLATGQPMGMGNGDISSDSAYELGRLLAMADGRFTRDMVAWHRIAEQDPPPPSLSAPAFDSIRLSLQGTAEKAAPAPPTGIAAALINRASTKTDHPANLWRIHPAARVITDKDQRDSSPSAGKLAKAP